MNLGSFYRDIYSAFGVAATLTIAEGEPPLTVTVNDLTKGVDVPDPANPGVKTTRPVARMRRSELSDAGLCADDLDDGSLALNGKCWRILSWGPRPSPNGEADGEIEMILVEIA